MVPVWFPLRSLPSYISFHTLELTHPGCQLPRSKGAMAVRLWQKQIRSMFSRRAPSWVERAWNLWNISTLKLFRQEICSCILFIFICCLEWSAIWVDVFPIEHGGSSIVMLVNSGVKILIYVRQDVFSKYSATAVDESFKREKSMNVREGVHVACECWVTAKDFKSSMTILVYQTLVVCPDGFWNLST